MFSSKMSTSNMMTSLPYWTLLALAIAIKTVELIPVSVDPPVKLSVHCWCASYPNVTFCSWAEPPHSQPLRYIASYSERRQPSISKHCHLTPPASSFSSSSSSSSSFERVWYCHLPNLKMLTNYIINVTTLSSTGSSSFHLSSFMLEDIVKPDPPVDVKVLAYHARNVLVGWSAPPTWSHLDMVPLKYQITYQWDHKGRTKSVSFPLESTAMELKGLSPGREYVFQVCTMDLLGLGQWSLWSSPITVTLPTIKMSQVRLLSES
ncbi:interleukin-27 subunit beta-like isoform X1 [Syngnathus typhle]|uniref:interleukin-27 subunit beta-like isoform X1 n=1 Tax=Syngnathus typhle TaxID=161592 RepID=UPI002A6B13A0|nr:interleukin-27 subunit beta-like isoform X1 [Syngnathus typhle]